MIGFPQEINVFICNFYGFKLSSWEENIFQAMKIVTNKWGPLLVSLNSENYLSLEIVLARLEIKRILFCEPCQDVNGYFGSS